MQYFNIMSQRVLPNKAGHLSECLCECFLKMFTNTRIFVFILHRPLYLFYSRRPTYIVWRLHSVIQEFMKFAGK